MKTNLKSPIAVLLSFTGTLDSVSSGELSDADLDQAIYCYGCGRTLLTRPTAEIINVHRAYIKNVLTAEVVRKVCEKTLLAEKEGRMVWRRDFAQTPEKGLAKLSEVLKKAGVEELNPNLPPPIFNDSRGLKIAIERVNNKNGNQRVVVVTSAASV